jgi:hypothetical protein
VGDDAARFRGTRLLGLAPGHEGAGTRRAGIIESSDAELLVGPLPGRSDQMMTIAGADPTAFEEWRASGVKVSRRSDYDGLI